MYEVTGLPPVVGGTTVIVACPEEVTAVGAPGIPGIPGTTSSDSTEEAEVPPTFVAVEVNVYVVPLVSPVMVHEPDDPVTVHVAPPGEAVTVYEVGVPPVDGATTVTVAWPLPATAVGFPGSPGGKVGVTAEDAADADDVPSALVAVEVNVYAVPLISPVTVHEPDDPVTVHVSPPGEAVTVYEVGVPPVDGATTVTVAEAFPGTAVGVPGAPGGLRGITGAEIADCADVPTELVAVAENVYVVPLVSPDITHDVAGTVTVQVAPPGNAVTVYEAGSPPLVGATTVIVADPDDATPIGAPGIPGGKPVTETATVRRPTKVKPPSDAVVPYSTK